MVVGEVRGEVEGETDAAGHKVRSVCDSPGPNRVEATKLHVNPSFNVQSG